MIGRRWIRHTALVALVVLPVLTAGCGLFSKETSQPIDPPPQDQSGSQVDMTDDAGSEQTSMGNLPSDGDVPRMTVYLQDSDGYLAPVALPYTLADGELPGQKALEMMVENGAYAAGMPEGFRAMLPQGTQILNYDVNPETKIATVDFSEPFVSYNPQDERAMLESIAWTLTASPEVKGVELYVEGERLSEMPVAGYPLDEALTRGIGINIELAEGVAYNASFPVTLYFSNQTLNEEQYYVPVTRLVARSDSALHAAMEELIEGPINKNLTGVIIPGMEVASIEEKDGVVTVDLLDETYEDGLPIPAEMLEAVVLSLTENTDAAAVQVMINGQSGIMDDHNRSYSEPVGRNHHVNALKS
ncbi:GerMN domain-containing protein [Paenibacillus sp. J5C_2022]|uniref:GerMN domain-containing protein n=1 Tax=Paenibacillus sp. J5C2022 TaxID=2977129 RepID=UPI0021CFCD53|nr:GerMN domain-containing protein [Paenibacillus sp. J5C2022]MCU6712462.1 GerMN domain-containing protein [Paenibacillus sp. J5C2022]